MSWASIFELNHSSVLIYLNKTIDFEPSLYKTRSISCLWTFQIFKSRIEANNYVKQEHSHNCVTVHFLRHPDTQVKQFYRKSIVYSFICQTCEISIIYDETIVADKIFTPSQKQVSYYEQDCNKVNEVKAMNISQLQINSIRFNSFMRRILIKWSWCLIQ